MLNQNAYKIPLLKVNERFYIALICKRYKKRLILTSHKRLDKTLYQGLLPHKDVTLHQHCINLYATLL